MNPLGIVTTRPFFVCHRGSKCRELPYLESWELAFWVGCFGVWGCGFLKTLFGWVVSEPWGACAYGFCGSGLRAQGFGLRVMIQGFQGLGIFFPTVAQQRPSNELHAVMNLTSGPVGSSEVTVHLAV